MAVVDGEVVLTVGAAVLVVELPADAVVLAVTTGVVDVEDSEQQYGCRISTSVFFRVGLFMLYYK